MLSFRQVIRGCGTSSKTTGVRLRDQTERYLWVFFLNTLVGVTQNLLTSLLINDQGWQIALLLWIHRMP